jgi:hypothetical protein
MQTPKQYQNKAKEFPSLAAFVQDDGTTQKLRDSRLQGLRNAYLPWYRGALSLFVERRRLDLQTEFMSLYKSKIKRFLIHGAKPYKCRGKWWAPDWVANSDRNFIDPLTEQINLLAALGE